MENNSIQFPLKNDLIFGLVMLDTTLCKELLERIMPDRKIRELRLCGGSNTELKDNHHRHHHKKRPSRCSFRRRQHLVRYRLDQARHQYRQLKHSYIIFICTFDHYMLNQTVHFFQNYNCKNCWKRK